MLLWTDCRAYPLAEGAALPPLTWCVIPPLPSSKCPNSRGTSCLAIIMLSLRDKIHSPAEALHKLTLMGARSRPSDVHAFGLSNRSVTFEDRFLFLETEN